jgi:hypothetical protein
MQKFFIFEPKIQKNRARRQKFKILRKNPERIPKRTPTTQRREKEPNQKKMRGFGLSIYIHNA